MTPRRTLISTAACTAIAVALLRITHAGGQPTAKADLLVTNGHVYTADPAAAFVEAVAVVGNRVAAVGSASQLAAYRGPATLVIDAGRSPLAETSAENPE